MTAEPWEAYATRLPPELSARIDAALDETELTEADILRSAVGYYVRRNPDGIRALAREGSVDRMLLELRGADE